MAILAKIKTESENAVSAFFHFQYLRGVKNGGTSLCRGKCE